MTGPAGMDAEPATEVDLDGLDAREVAPGLRLLDLGEGGGGVVLVSDAYGVALDPPRRPEDLEAVGLYCVCACDRLAAVVEGGPGFATPGHRRDLWMALHEWARLVLRARAAAEGRGRARREEEALAATLDRLRRDAGRLRAAVVGRPEVVAALLRNGVALGGLVGRLDAFAAGVGRVRPRRRRGRPATPAELGEALELLGDLYLRATGKRPTLVVRERPEGRGHDTGGPSLAFARVAAAPLFPEAGSLVDDWRAVSRKMRAGTHQ